MPILVICALIISLIAILFALQNSYTIPVSFLVWQFDGSLALVLLLTLALGVVIGLLVSIPTILKRGWKSSTQKRQLNKLEAQFEDQEYDVSRQRQNLETIRKTHQALLASLSLTERQTGLLEHRSVKVVLSYFLDQMKEHSDRSYPASLCLFLIELDESDPSFQLNQSLWPALSSRLQAELSPSSWLHFDGKHRFYCFTLGMDMDKAADYGGDLCSNFDDPIRLSNGSEIPVSLKIGGVIAQPQTSASSQGMLDQAEQVLQKAKRLGHHRFRLAPAKV